MTFDNVGERIKVPLDSIEVLLLELCGILYYGYITGILFWQSADNRQCLDKHTHRVHQFCAATTVIDGSYHDTLLACHTMQDLKESCHIVSIFRHTSLLAESINSGAVNGLAQLNI